MIAEQALKDKLFGSLNVVIPEMTLKVRKNDRYLYFVQIVSPLFEDLDEADRQSLVWERILSGLDTSEWKTIEFIYTDAPSEIEPDESEPASSVPSDEHQVKSS